VAEEKLPDRRLVFRSRRRKSPPANLIPGSSRDRLKSVACSAILRQSEIIFVIKNEMIQKVTVFFSFRDNFL
jgi:hypothetical protein